MGWALIQQKPVQTSGSPTATYVSATTAGNLLVAALGVSVATTITMPSGWTQRAFTQHSVTPPIGTLLIASKIADGTETAVTFTSSSNPYALEILEFSGNAVTGSEFDAASAGTQQASGVTSVQPGSLTPAKPQELFIAAEYNSSGGANTGSEAADSGFTVLDAATFTTFIPAYKIKSDALAENPTLSWATTQSCFCIQAAFIPPPAPHLNRALVSQAVMRAATR